MKIIGRLSQTVQIWRLRQARSEAKVLRLEDKACCRSIKERLIGAPSSNSKRERIVCVSEDQSRICGIKATITLRSRPDRLLNLKYLLSGIVDLNVQSAL